VLHGKKAGKSDAESRFWDSEDLRIRADEDTGLNLHGSLGRSYVAEYRNLVLLST
jgi:hypothetical protein